MEAFELTDETIKEIAENLDCGFLVYIHKKTGNIISLPDFGEYGGTDEELWAEELESLENEFIDYYQVDKPASFESFRFMEDFVEMVDNPSIKRRLENALSKRKPFREFKYEIDDSGEYRELWFGYKAERMKDWVKTQLHHTLREDEEEQLGD